MAREDTILLVDDQAIVLEPIAAALRAEGFRTVTASDGEAGLRAVRDHGPAVVLLDVSMPRMDGLQMLRHMRAAQESKDIPVIMLSGKGEKSIILEAASLGINGYMLKSRFRLEELITLLRKLVPTQASEPAESSASGPQGAARSHDSARAAAPPGSPPASVGAPLPRASPTSATPSAEARGALQSMRPLQSRDDVVKQLGAIGELRGFSPAVAEVLKLTANTRCSMESVSRAISRDHGLALKILKLANSAVYTRGEPVQSVQTAVLRIGLGQIRQAVLNIAVIDRFAGNSAGAHLDAGPFWEHAIATGLIAAEITHARNAKDAEAAFTTGLLHDVGRMLLLEAIPEAYGSVLEAADRLGLPTEQVEQRLLGMQHAEVMEHTLKLWNFSKQLVTPIVLHHLSAGNIRATAPQQIEEVATVALANRLAHALQLGHAGNRVIYPTEELCELLSLTPEVVARIEQVVPDETVKVKFALLATSTQAGWQPLRDINREAIGEPFVPVYVSSAPAFDAHRVFCESLTAEPVDEDARSATVGVVHAREARELASLWAHFLEAEREAGAAHLPTIFITPTAKVSPTPAMQEGRRTAHLTTPFAVDQFIRAAQSLLSAAEVEAGACVGAQSSPC